MTTPNDVPRCARGPRCADSTVLTLGDEGGKVTVGAELADGRAVCETCIRHLGWVLTSLPVDIVELTSLLVPTMQVGYADPDMPVQPRSKKNPPLPLDGNAEALRALIDHKVTGYAESTAAAAGVEWSSEWARRSRIGARVQAGCQLLAARLDWLLGLEEQDYRARSVGEDPTDGHDLDEITRYGDDVWIREDGTTSALELFRLHEQVERFVGRAAMDRCPLPCPRCRQLTLFRVHPRSVVSGSLRLGQAGHVVCRGCWTRYSDSEYDELLDVTTRLFGVHA